MNYYAQGGQAHGIKSLAQDLAQYGRGGDTMVAHINPQEAEMLKAMGGSGTINPTTGLPEFLSFKSVTKPFQQAAAAINPFNPGSGVNKVINQIPVVGQANQALNNLGTQIFQPLEKAIVQPVSAGLANFDKAVGKTIPGGWGTVGTTALSMVPGAQPFAIGLSALNSSGVMRKGGNFNLQGAIMGGAMAYGMSELGEYARAAGGAADAVEKVAEEGLKAVPPPTNDFIGSFASPNPPTGGDFISGFSGANPAVPPSPPSFGSNVMSGDFGAAAKQISTGISEGVSNMGTSVGNAYDTVTNPETYSKAIDNATKGMSDTLSGAGKILTGSADPAAAAAVKAGTTMSPLLATGMTVYTGMGLQALEDQRKYLKDQAASGAISNAEYNAELARIEAQAEQARQVVAANPLQVNPGVAGIEKGPSLYDKEDSGETTYGRKNSSDTLYDKNPYGGTTLYAMGGAVNPPDDQTYMPNQTPMQRFENNGLMSMIGNTVPEQMYAAGGIASGGMPRFLSGGGDGMSDSIKASINDSQEARLADGEFVVPADVVSHIGNGSSKAGAKQLYSMMDRVRQARTGRKSQGKQINPRKYLAA